MPQKQQYHIFVERCLLSFNLWSSFLRLLSVPQKSFCLIPFPMLFRFLAVCWTILGCHWYKCILSCHIWQGKSDVHRNSPACDLSYRNDSLACKQLQNRFYATVRRHGWSAVPGKGKMRWIDEAVSYGFIKKLLSVEFKTIQKGFCGFRLQRFSKGRRSEAALENYRESFRLSFSLWEVSFWKNDLSERDCSAQPSRCGKRNHKKCQCQGQGYRKEAGALVQRQSRNPA